MCPKCGITTKSGKLSCCGRGGSWFGNCGAAGEGEFDHEWSEGFEACKARSQSEIVVGQHSHREEESDIKYEKKKFVTFKKKELPKHTRTLGEWLEEYTVGTMSTEQQNKIDNLLNYLTGRGIGPDWYDFMYSSDKHWDVDKRLLIPFYWRGDIVGFTGRMFEQSDKVKYYTDVQPGYVFNMDAQDWTRKFVIVTEGPFDAITISGVSILGSEINDTQRELIDGLGRQVIVVPDRDAPGEKLINQAKEFGWSVAFPEWEDGVNDIAEAVQQYGRLFTIQSILKTTESNKLKIDLKRKMYG